MRIATIVHQGRSRVGRVDADEQGESIALFEVDGTRGALALMDGLRDALDPRS